MHHDALFDHRTMIDGGESCGPTFGMVREHLVKVRRDAPYCLFRLMVDVEHQGKGYGIAAMRLAFLEMKNAGARRVRTMHRPENTVAALLYKQLGFSKIGMLDDGDVELELSVKVEWLSIATGYVLLRL